MPRNRLDRLTFSQLRTAPGAEFSPGRAVASAAGRIAAGGFCLCLPLLGFALGVPPKRSTTGFGLGVGILIVVLFWKAAALVEDHLADIAPLADAMIVMGCCWGAWALLNVQDARGFGAIERFLASFLRSFAGARLSFRPVRSGNAG